MSLQLHQSCSNPLTTNNSFKRDFFFFQDFLGFAALGVRKEFSCISLSPLEGKKLDRYITSLILSPCASHMCYWREISVQGTCEKLKEDKGAQGTGMRWRGEFGCREGPAAGKHKLLLGKGKMELPLPLFHLFPSKINALFLFPDLPRVKVMPLSR